MRLVSFHSPVRRRAPLNRGLLRWWMAEPFRNGGPRLQDLMNRSPMTISGALRLGPRGRPGGFGSAVFNGTSDYGQTAAIDLSGITTMTLSFWLYWDAFADDGDAAIESSDSSATNQHAILINPNSSTTRFSVRIRATAGASNQFGFTRPSAAAWHHYVCCMDRNGGAQQVTAVYVDGVSQSLTSEAANTTSGNFGNFAWNFMARNGASLFGAGRLDDIRIYNRILSAWEARALMHASRRGYPQELRWSRGVDFGGYVEAAPQDPETPPIPGTGSYGSCIGFGVEDDLATAKSLPDLPPGTNMALITAEGGAVRWRADGSDPGNDSGHYIAPTQTIRWLGPFANMKFIRDDVGMTPSITVSYFG